MIKRFILSIKPLYFRYLIAFILQLWINANAFSQEATKKTIMDYYLKLPPTYFTCEDRVVSNESFRKSIIKIQDVQNGYILSIVEGMQLEVALFKDKIKGRDIIATFEEAGPGGMCTKRAFLVLQTDGSWKDVMADICPTEEEIFKQLGLPENSDIFIDYVIPQYGTTIKLVNFDTNQHFGNLKWAKGKFEVNKIQ